MGSTVGIFTESLEKYFNRSVATAMEFTVAIVYCCHIFVVDCYGLLSWRLLWFIVAWKFSENVKVSAKFKKYSHTTHIHSAIGDADIGNIYKVAIAVQRDTCLLYVS